MSWLAPEDEGASPIQGYVVRALLEGVVAQSQEGTGTALTLTGLTNGEVYTLVVVATNAQGEGRASTPLEGVTPRVIPGAPREVSAMPGAGSAEVSWLPPEDTGMPIIGYTVTIRQGETVVATVASTEPQVTVSGLTNGTDYLVSVAASNSVVSGPESAPVAVTPVSVPGAPRVVVSSRTETSLTFVWFPEDTGGSPITGYRVVLREGDTVVQTADTTETRYWFRNLTTSTPYRFSVVAINALGEGVPAEFLPQRPCGLPDAPTRPKVVSADGQFTFTWVAPLNTRGCPVLDYQVQITPVEAGTPDWIARTTEPRIVATGFQNGVLYSLTVSAQNEAGLSDPAETRSRPTPVPGAPVDFTAQAIEGMVYLSWKRPTANNELVSVYGLTVQSEHGEELRYIGGHEVEQWLEGLTYGTLYTFSLYAENHVGIGPSVSAQVTPVAP